MDNSSKTGVIFVLIRDGKILMQQRDGNCKKYPYKWCVPGGKCDDGEDYETTLLREIKEEYDLDLEIEDCTFFMDYPIKNNKVYICKVDHEQEPKLQEGLDMKWFFIDEIEKLDLGFGQEELIEALKNYLN